MANIELVLLTRDKVFNYIVEIYEMLNQCHFHLESWIWLTFTCFMIHPIWFHWDQYVYCFILYMEWLITWFIYVMQWYSLQINTYFVHPVSKYKSHHQYGDDWKNTLFINTNFMVNNQTLCKLNKFIKLWDSINISESFCVCRVQETCIWICIKQVLYVCNSHYYFLIAKQFIFNAHLKFTV